MSRDGAGQVHHLLGLVGLPAAAVEARESSRGPLVQRVGVAPLALRVLEGGDVALLRARPLAVGAQGVAQVERRLRNLRVAGPPLLQDPLHGLDHGLAGAEDGDVPADARAPEAALDADGGLPLLQDLLGAFTVVYHTFVLSRSRSLREGVRAVTAIGVPWSLHPGLRVDAVYASGTSGARWSTRLSSVMFRVSRPVARSRAPAAQNGGRHFRRRSIWQLPCCSRRGAPVAL